MGKILKNGIAYAGGGAEGKSAYQTWLDLGNEGTEQDFLDSLSRSGFSPTIEPNPDNTDDVYKLDITTKDGKFTTPNLKGGDEVTKYEYVGTGNLSGETYYSYEDLSTKIGETVEVTVSNRYGETQGTLTIISKISNTELEVDNGAWIDTIMLTNTQIIDAKIIDDDRTSTTSTWSSVKVRNELMALEPNMQQLFIVTGEYSIDDDDNWIVSNVDKTFTEIDEAISNNQDVVLKIFPEGDTTNPYILHPAMHYANMGTAFSLMISDEGQISGLSIMITADNQVIATRNEYDFSEFNTDKLEETIEILKSTIGYTCKNLIPHPYGTSAIENRGIVFTPNADGTISFSGTANDPTAAFYTFSDIMYLPAGSYKITGGNDIYGGVGVLLYDDKDCTITYTGGHEGLLTISTTSVYIFNTLDGTVNWNKDTNPYGYEKEFTIDKPAYVKVQARGVNNTYTEEVNGLIYPMVRLAIVEDNTWEIYQPNVDTRLKNLLGGKEVKAINNQFGSATKLFKVTTAPTESGKCYTIKLVAQRKNATAHIEYLSVSRVNDTYTYDCNIEVQEKNGSTGEATTMENSNFLIVDANYEVWAHIPSYTYAYIELISPNARGTFTIDGSEGEIAEDTVLDTFSKREIDVFAKKGDVEALKKSVSDGKSAVAGAITAKGVDTAADAEFAIMAENISKISTDHNLVFKQSNITDKSLTPVFGNGVFVAYHSTDKVVYYSKDGGETWNTSSLDVSTSTGAKIVYAKKHKIFIGKFTDVGLYTSYDGNVWTLRLSATNVNDFLYDEDTGIAIAGHSSGSNGLWYSHNGYNWTVNGSYSGKKISNFKAAGGRLYATIAGGSYTSLNGSTWTAISSFSSQTIGSIRYEHGLWMVNLSNVTAGHSWYYSTDGINFTKSTVTFNNTIYGTDFMGFKHIVGTTWVIVMYTGIWYTTDSGKNWTASNLGITTGNWSLFAYADKFYAASAGGPGATYGGLYYSTDGKTWTATTGITDGGSGASTSGKTFILQGKCFISPSGIATLRGIYYLNSNGTSWTKVDSLNDDYVAYADDDILISKKGKYSFDGINWKNVDKSDLNNISAELANIYYGGGSLISSLSPATSGMIYAHLVK